ncbi:FMN-dependent NADH-azoreductase [compost metagenome]
MVKAYIDAICIAGKTFQYTANGPEGLLKGKKAVHIQARGGIYSEGPAKELEFGDRYLRSVLNFIGIADFESVIAEGMAQNPKEADHIKEKAVANAKEIARTMTKASVH